jgi:hypothetical protein
MPGEHETIVRVEAVAGTNCYIALVHTRRARNDVAGRVDGNRVVSAGAVGEAKRNELVLRNDAWRTKDIGASDSQVDFTSANGLRSVKVKADRNLLTGLCNLRRERKLSNFATISLASVGGARIKVNAKVNRIRVCFGEQRRERYETNSVAQSRANASIQPSFFENDKYIKERLNW